MSDRSGKEKPVKYFDYSLLFLIIFLVGFGLVMLYSVSSYEAEGSFGNAAYYLERQGIFALGGMAGMLLISRIPYGFWKKVSPIVYLLAFLLCAAVIFVGDDAGGSQRWLQIGPIRFQPSELAKIGVIIYVAAVLSKMPRKIRDFKTVVKVLIRVAPIILVIAKSNLSTGIIVAGICILMMFVASPKYSHFLRWPAWWRRLEPCLSSPSLTGVPVSWPGCTRRIIRTTPTRPCRGCTP